MINKEIKGYSHEKFKTSNTHVFKYTENPERFGFVIRQYEWLKDAQSFFPENSFDYLELIKDKNICGYVMNNIKTEELTIDDAPKIINIIDKFTNIKHSEICIYSMNNFKTYSEYVKKVIIKNLDEFTFLDLELYDKLLNKYCDFADKQKSYCHGDFTIDNMLKDKNNNKIILIDPNKRDDLWSSYLLDIAKLYQETFSKRLDLYEEIEKLVKKEFNFSEDEMNFIDLLHVSHYIRMIPYTRKYPEIHRQKIDQLKNLYSLKVKSLEHYEKSK